MSTQAERSLPLRQDAALRGGGEPLSEAFSMAPVDRVHLSRYTLGNAELDREILGLFLAQLPLSIEQLRFAVTDREWQIAAHTIKGSARAVGAWHVSRLAAEAEKIPGGGGESERAAMLSRLEEAFEAVQIYVEQEFLAGPAHV